MDRLILKKLMLYITTLFSFTACIEPFEFETRDAEGILVVQTSMTDIVKNQFVVLSRAADLANVNIEFDSLDVRQSFVPATNERLNPENGAKVELVDDQGNVIEFTDKDNGLYESTLPFGLAENTDYQLRILTANQETYESGFESLSGKSKINDLYVERGFNENGEEGVIIYADGANLTDESDFFRYDYVETYKIIAPTYSGLQVEIIREEGIFVNDTTFLWPDVRLQRRQEEERVCFNSNSSVAIDLANTNTLSAAILEGHVVRFINRNNAIISHRYSMLLNQYVINSGAYNYYQNLSNFAQSESVFSEIQPGFLEGNIRRTDVEDGLVLGYFEVASVDRKRVFFSYADLFPGEELPPFFGNTNCDRLLSPALGNPEKDGPQPLGCPPPALIRRVKAEELNYFAINEDPGECEGPYYMTPSICGDCTILGTNVKPDFWIE
ncbi:DUF4249 domain-containing protein [Maribacter sp.]